MEKSEKQKQRRSEGGKAQPTPRPDAVMGPYDVYKQIGALIGLALLQSLSFGILAPMLPIITTEVCCCFDSLSLHACHLSNHRMCIRWPTVLCAAGDRGQADRLRSECAQRRELSIADPFSTESRDS